MEAVIVGNKALGGMALRIDGVRITDTMMNTGVDKIERAAKAINCTYGQNIPPEAVGLMVEALKACAEHIRKAEDSRAPQSIWDYPPALRLANNALEMLETINNDGTTTND